MTVVYEKNLMHPAGNELMKNTDILLIVTRLLKYTGIV